MKNYTDFATLPDGVKQVVKRMRPNDYESWVHEPVAALDGKSLIDTMNIEDVGEATVTEYLKRVEGYFLDGN